MRQRRISEAAKAAGVGVETIRFYERRGLIEQPAKPADGGFRHYPEETVRRIRFIREAQELGFSLRETAELLSLRADAQADAAEVREHVHAKLADVDVKLARLGDIRRALAALLEACPGQGPLRGCSIIEALERAERGQGHARETVVRHASNGPGRGAGPVRRPAARASARARR